MKRSPARTSRIRIAIAMLAVFALLFQCAFVIACDAHDLSHDFSWSDPDGEGHDDILGSSETISGQQLPGNADEARWHEVFAAGHGIAQVLETAATWSIDALALSCAKPAATVHDRIPPAPLNTPLRPPIGC